MSNAKIEAEFNGKQFEELLDELEHVAEQMASGDVGIEKATELYERAGVLQRLAKAKLDDVQARIDAITEQADRD